MITSLVNKRPMAPGVEFLTWIHFKMTLQDENTYNLIRIGRQM